MDLQRVSVGIPATAGAEVARRVAPLLEDAGFGALWINETQARNALDIAAAALGATTRLRVATGVIPVDRRPASELLDDLARLEPPMDRLTLGVGSGAARSGALALMRDTVAALRDGGAGDIVLGALGPRMRALAAEVADGVLLNWLTPSAARDQAVEHHAVAPAGRVALYVRTAVDSGGVARLLAEAARYAAIPNYAANFARLGCGPLDTAIDPATVAERVAAYVGAVDEVVLRAMTRDETPDDFARFVERARDLILGA